MGWFWVVGKWWELFSISTSGSCSMMIGSSWVAFWFGRGSISMGGWSGGFDWIA